MYGQITRSNSPSSALNCDPDMQCGQAQSQVQQLACLPGQTQTSMARTQVNNAYVFPAIGHAAVLTRASVISDDVFLTAAEALSHMSPPEVRSCCQSWALAEPFDSVLSNALPAYCWAEHRPQGLY